MRPIVKQVSPQKKQSNFALIDYQNKYVEGRVSSVTKKSKKLCSSDTKQVNADIQVFES